MVHVSRWGGPRACSVYAEVGANSVAVGRSAVSGCEVWVLWWVCVRSVIERCSTTCLYVVIMSSHTVHPVKPLHPFQLPHPGHTRRAVDCWRPAGTRGTAHARVIASHRPGVWFKRKLVPAAPVMLSEFTQRSFAGSLQSHHASRPPRLVITENRFYASDNCLVDTD